MRIQGCRSCFKSVCVQPEGTRNYARNFCGLSEQGTQDAVQVLLLRVVLFLYACR